MKVELSPKAYKALTRLNNPMRERIIKALERLEIEPPQGDIRSLSGRDGFRVRVGGYRILFQVTDDSVVVLDIGARGDVYKGG